MNTELSIRAARVAAPYAAAYGVLTFVLGLLDLIPVVGLLFGCVGALVGIVGYVGVGYLTGQRIGPLPTDGGVASVVGVGLGAAVDISVVTTITTLILGIVQLALHRHGVAYLAASVCGNVVLGLLLGTVLASLGTYLAIKNAPAAAVEVFPPSPF